MSLQQRIQADLTAAMKARDRARVSALRMAMAAIRNAAVEAARGAQGELADETVEQLLRREVKRRREAARSYRDAGREDRAAAEEAEAEVYASYLPAPLTDQELVAIVDRAFATTGAQGPQDMGKVMGAAMPEIRGRADGGRVSALVRARLAG
ncbi:MAG TPA: GatB/YqeY domain-containing protein [Nitriliruptorales bacterium]|nr:GatB/YqeY domain-containing protein [Nitriliruptorales bacterium]